MKKEEFVEKVVDVRDMLFRVAFSMLPVRFDQEDAVQETIRIALQKHDTLRHDEHFKTWIVRILINECNKLLRRKKREVLQEDIYANLSYDANLDMMEAFMSLDIKVRMPMVLSCVEGYSVKEISRMMNLPEGTVKWRMSRGRDLLRMQLEEGRAK